MSKPNIDCLKWSNKDIISFLGVYRNYEQLWDTNNENYLKKNAKEDAYKKLLNELIALGFEIASLEQLKHKIKNIKDTYRNEINKIKKSMKSGAGADDIYNTKLQWFKDASFLRNIMSGRESSSNLDLSQRECLPVDCNLDNENQSTESESTLAATAAVNERISEALRNKRAAIVKNAGPPKKASKTYSNFEESVSQLRNIADSIVDKEDEYDRFALHIAAQLRKLPEISFVILQDQIQSLITKERLKNIKYSNSSEGTSRTSNSLLNTLSPQATYQPITTLLGQQSVRSTPSPYQQNMLDEQDTVASQIITRDGYIVIEPVCEQQRANEVLD